MLAWLRRMQSAFGTSFLWLVSLIYFSQGFRSFVWTAVSYQTKDILKLSPSASQTLVSIAFIPWSIKPFYGILSDCIPIGGRKRIPYLMLAIILSLFPWILLGAKASFRSSLTTLIVLLTVQNLGSAMADVVIDAMIAEAVRSERVAFAGDLQSVSWLSMAIGGICGSLFGGYALTNLPINTIFLIFSILPTIQLFSCGLVKETRLDIKDSENSENSRSLHSTEKPEVNGNARPAQDLSGLQRRRKGKGKNYKGKKTINRSDIEDLPRSLVKTWYLSLRSAICSLCRTFKQPIILRPMAWFFLAQVTVPNLSTIMFYYQTEFLHLEASFLGSARVLGWAGLMLGTFIYNRFLRRMTLRRILTLSHIGLAVLSLFDIALVSRANVRFDISDKLMVLFGSAIADAINQLKMMPFLIISGQLCPPGIEGTLFALFMSINNLGSTLGSFVGAGLASLLSISSESYDNLLSGIYVQIICTFIPVAFIFLIPKEATGMST